MTQFATQDDHTWLYTDDAAVRERAYGLAADLGVTGVRFVVYESYVARMGWGFVQRAVFEATAHELAPQLVLTGPPRWDPNGGRLDYARPSPAGFAEWVREAATTLPSVKRWSLWNEPNLPQFLPQHPDVPHDYARLYDAGYTALRAEMPHVEILFGELSGGARARTFLRRAAAHFEADGVAIHPYQFSRPPAARPIGDTLDFSGLSLLGKTLRNLARIGRLTRRDGHRQPPIFVTEFGYPAPGWPHARRPIERARWLKEAAQRARRRGDAQFLYYHLIGAPIGTAWNTGIARLPRQGGKVLSPAYLALREEIRSPS